MNRRRLSPFALSALCLGALAAGAHAQVTLTVDGRASVKKLMNSTLQIVLTGQPGAHACLILDADPGPTMIFGKSVPLGFSPATVVIGLGQLPPSGTVTLNVGVPSAPSLHDQSIYLLGVVANAAAPAGFDCSNQSDVTILDRDVPLAGNGLGQYPHFEYVSAFNRGSSVEVAVDPTVHPFIAGRSADIYVVASKTRDQWIADGSLTDVRAGGAQTVLFSGADIQSNTFTVDTGMLSGPDESAGSGDTRIGVGYDIVVDFDQNGTLGGVDLIDGYDNGASGMYVVRDTESGSTKGSPGAGPYAVTEIIYSGGTWLGQDTYYPSNIETLGQLPLVVVSHGNGHNYQWYDHIGYHLASYGYIVMSHTNLTGPGSDDAAISTLNNTEYIIQNQGTIGGGALSGHIDTTLITWIGHSRGADGVARAYDRLFTGMTVPVNFRKQDIKLISSIAPVDFGGYEGEFPTLGGTGVGSNPRDVPQFHLFVAEADADVNGCATSNQLLWYHLHDRATRARASCSLYGVGHGDYHDGGGSSVASGPNLIGRPATHEILRGYLLPLVAHTVLGDVPSRDFLWRQYESFHAIGSPTGPEFVANLMFQDDAESGKYIIDDFQDILTAGPTPTVASSGATVSKTTPGYREDRAFDAENGFTFSGTDTFNGFTMDSRQNTASSRAFRSDSFASVFRVDGKGDYEITFDMTTAMNRPRFCNFEYLSFRSAQGTRHPLTIVELADVTFTVTLEDGSGNQSSINIGAYGGGIEEPYQRTGFGCGTGNGWNSEFETIRVRLADFLNNGNTLDLADIEKVIFQFGPSWGSTRARLGLDEVELTNQ